MEAVGALRRGGLSTYREALGELVRARSRAFWIVVGLTALAAAVRFATLGLQSYHHDEVVTVNRILPGSFWHAMDAVGYSESAPPLYYAFAWLWTQVTGTAELGLRSFSALAGVLTVPVAYWIGAELRGRRTGIAAAALVAVNPMLIWYSQEARAYALFALLTSLSLLYFLRARDVPPVKGHYGYSIGGTSARGRDVMLWGVFSALALATHYFAVFPVAVEALWLLWARRREVWRGIATVAGAGLLLAPLALHQMSIGHAEWIGGHTLGNRLWGTGLTFLLGETGDVIAQPEHPLLVLVPGLLALAALGLVALRGERDDRRAAAVPLLIAAATVALPVALGLLDPGKDYVLARNLLPALVSLLAAVAVGLTLRRARRAGVVVGIALVAYSLAFSVWASVSPALQRPDWSAVADALGEPRQPRAIVTWTLGAASLRYYLPTSSFQARSTEGYAWLVGEVDFVSNGAAPPPPRRLLGPGFREAGEEQLGRLHVRRYEHPGPGLVPLRLGAVRTADLGFHSNGVLLNGIGPG
ncbi:MAG: glycosyltransferase family 39 protein [Chloroflexota bacterium]